MINAIKEYKQMVMAPGWRWLRIHWKGYVLFLAIVLVFPTIMMYLSEIKEKVKNKFERRSEEVKP